MTNLVIGGAGYTNASQYLGDANRWASVALHTVSTALADTGSMAGDSSFATEFATAYDEAATSLVGAYGDVVDALASLCRLAYGSYENHYRAEQSSIMSTVVVSAEPSRLTDVLYAAAPPTPPSSLGGDLSIFPDWANVILDHVEGFVWPDADLDKLRAAAAAWREAATQLDCVEDLTDNARSEIMEERSPEIYSATMAIHGVAKGARELATACEQVATMCEEYAAAVETQRQLILDLVNDLIRDAVLIQAAGFLFGLVTGGTTNAVAVWINSGRLAAEAPKFKAFVETVRAAGAGAAGVLRTGTDAVIDVRNRLSAMRNLGPIRSGGHAAVLEAGAITRMRALLVDLKRFDPTMLKGMSRRDVRELLSHWDMTRASSGSGLVFGDPIHKGRQIRVMRGYYKGNRPDPMTHGDYLVFSQGGQKPIKVALEGNPTL